MFAPVLMALSENYDHRVARAFALDMLGWFTHPQFMEIAQAIPGMARFIQVVYTPWRVGMETQYGGKLERAFLTDLFSKGVYPT
jgi:hypothetical protein